MRVAVAGAGVAGLVAARRLAREGHAVDVYERWPGLGGQAATLDVGGGHRLERYYHHWFTSDRHVVDLCDELGVGVEWHPSSVGMFARGRVHPFTTPFDLLRFGPLPLRSRVRMGRAVLALQRSGADPTPFEAETARAWIEREMGEDAWAVVWGPLLRGKFGDRAEDITMAWLHSKLTLRRLGEGREARKEMLGYPSSSFEPLFAALQGDVETHGGRVLIDRPIARLERLDEGGVEVTPGAPGSFRSGHDPRRFSVLDAERYDAVVATVPSDVFPELLGERLVAEVGDEYLERVRGVEYHTALCLLLEIDRSFGRFYWTNIADADVPFVGIVEHTNFVDPARYDGRRFLYVANYLEPGDPLLSFDADQVLARYIPALRRVRPDFGRDWVRDLWLHREPAAQPIVTLGYRDRIPPLQTPAPGLVLANTTQIYPEDRGTNYAVRLGEEAAAAVA